MTSLDELLAARNIWLLIADDLLRTMLSTDGPYPIGDMLEVEINIEILTSKIAVLDTEAADCDEGGEFFDGYVDRRIPHLLAQLRRSTPNA